MEGIFKFLLKLIFDLHKLALMNFLLAFYSLVFHILEKFYLLCPSHLKRLKFFPLEGINILHVFLLVSPLFLSLDILDFLFQLFYVVESLLSSQIILHLLKVCHVSQLHFKLGL